MASVVYVAGARPNFVKIAPILQAVRGGPFESVLVHTGQHYDFAMSGVFFEQLGIPTPNVHLEVGSSSHGVQTGRIMAAFEEYLLARAERPRGIVVVGDVNSTMACSLVGAKLRIPVAHVEAGLRSNDRDMPEEINRVVTDAVSERLLVSEPAGLENLAREGIGGDRIAYVGNVMIDSLVRQLDAAKALAMPERFGSNYALVTIHRPSNVDSPHQLAAMVGFLEKLASALTVVFPVHPRTQKRLVDLGLWDTVSATARVCPPLGYQEFLGLMAGARVVVTDSGGVQEETTYLDVPCVTLRTTTERPVTITHGTNVLVGEDLDAAYSAVTEVRAGRRKATVPIEGWDGHAADRVAKVLVEAWA